MAVAELSLRALEERVERLDAKARVSPGQLGLDFSAAAAPPPKPAAAAGKGPGGGEKCGAGWIDPKKECRKNEPVDDRPIGQRKGTPARAGSESERQPGADSGTSLAARTSEARQRLVRTLAEVGELDEKTADLVASFFLASPKEGGAGVASLDPHIGQFTVKHGGFMDRGAINKSVSAAMQWEAGRQRAKRREGFLKGLSPIARGKAQKALEVMVRNTRTGYVTRQELVEERVAEGFAPITTEKGERRLANRDGVFLTVRDVSAAGMDYAAHLIASQQTQPVLTNPDRYDPGLAPKAKPEGINAQEVTTSTGQAQLARQQRRAAQQAGDQKGAEAWRQQERAAERDRLQNALSRGQQNQASLFGVTEYDETMPLFRQRRDSVDPVAQLCSSILREQLPGAQVLDWSRQPRGITAGRAVSEGLVYRFRLDAESIGYRPAWEGIDERQWELRSEGFLAARDPSARLDYRRGGVKFQQKTTKRQCSKGYGCGAACISLSKECRVQPKSAISKVRLRQLQALAQEGDQKAATQAQELQMQREAKAQSLVKGRQTARLEKMLQDPRVAEMVRTGKVPEAAAGDAKPGQVRDIKPSEVEVDAERFQYKIGSSASGEVGSLSGVQRWDPNLAGVISVWQDPEDGKTYVVNGHNRLALAKRLGAEEVTVRYLKAGSAQEARAIGAMQNIAEGAGTEIDAGKFFRDSGLKTIEEVKAKGLPLKSGKAEKGLALAQLPDEMFNDVVQGNLRVRRAAVIGGSGLDQDKQREVYKVLKARPSMTDETLQEYVEHLAVSSRQTQTEIDLFGTSEKSVDTGLARAELANGLKKALGREARLLGAVSRNAQAVELLEQKGGNTINVEQSQQQAGEASSVLRFFDQLKSVSGPVAASLDQAAARVTAGENRNKVARELRQQVVQAMEKELRQLGLRKEAAPVDDLTMNLFDSADRFDALDDRLSGLQTRMDRRCQRPDGTYYGTSGQCRKGKQAGAMATGKARGNGSAMATGMKPKESASQQAETTIVTGKSRGKKPGKATKKPGSQKAATATPAKSKSAQAISPKTEALKDIRDEVAVRQQLQTEEKRIRSLPDENIVVINPKGEVLYRGTEGDSNHVKMGKDKSLYDDFLTVTHNHPESGNVGYDKGVPGSQLTAGFSPGDLKAAIKRYMAEMRVVGATRSYSFKPSYSQVENVGLVVDRAKTFNEEIQTAYQIGHSSRLLAESETRRKFDKRIAEAEKQWWNPAKRKKAAKLKRMRDRSLRALAATAHFQEQNNALRILQSLGWNITARRSRELQSVPSIKSGRRDSLDVLEARIDALRRKCQTGYACGSSCISADKDCRSEGRATTGKERLKRLEQAAQGGATGRGIGRLKGGAAAAKVEQIKASRSEQAAQLRQERAQRRPAGGALVPTGGTGPAVTPEVVQPGSSTGRPGSIASTMREALNAMKAADARQMGMVAEQLFETDWLLERRGRYRGMSKDQAREQYKVEFMQKLHKEASSPEAAARKAEMGRKAAEAGSISGAMRSLLEDMKASDDRLNDLTRQAIDLRVGAEEQFGGEGDEPGLGGTSNRRRLGRGRRRDAADDRFDAAIDRLQALSVRLDQRCKRPDGSFYGTSGKCRKGKLAGAARSLGERARAIGRRLLGRGQKASEADAMAAAERIQQMAAARKKEEADRQAKEKAREEELLSRGPQKWGVKQVEKEEVRGSGDKGVVWHESRYEVQLEEPLRLPARPGKEPRLVDKLSFQVAVDEANAKPIARKLGEQGIALSNEQVNNALELAWLTGAGGGEAFMGADRMELPKNVARRFAMEVSKQVKGLVSNMEEGQIVLCKAHQDDGYGDKRRSLYERAGFTFIDGIGIAVVRNGRLSRIEGARGDRLDAGDVIDLDGLILALLTLEGDAR